MALSEREKCAHLLRRFGLGASEAEISYYMEKGLNGAIETLLQASPDKEVVDLPIEAMENDKGNIQIQGTAVWFGARMLITQQPLLEKMTLFWHNHFATSADKVTSPYIMAEQNTILRNHALGSFKELLLNVSKDPAMLIWLDGQDNIKGRANENFAREIMELFTLGVGNYSEKDIQEAARAFTGWSFVRSKKGQKKARAEYMFKPALHDGGQKTVLGKTGPMTGEQVIDLLCAQPRTAEFITEKIWNWFVYPNPSAATLKPFVNSFRESNLNISSLLRAIMKSDEFYSEKAVRKLVKNPADFCISTLRCLGMGEITVGQIKERLASENKEGYPNLRVPAGMVLSMKSQGMWLMFPPDVSGWKPGESWITSATMLERIQWANKIMGVSAKAAVAKYPMYNLLANDPTPAGIAQKLCSIFDAPVTGSKLKTLTSAAEKAMGKDGLSPRNANQVAASVMRLMFGSPEFQFA